MMARVESTWAASGCATPHTWNSMCCAVRRQSYAASRWPWAKCWRPAVWYCVASGQGLAGSAAFTTGSRSATSEARSGAASVAPNAYSRHATRTPVFWQNRRSTGRRGVCARRAWPAGPLADAS